MSAATNCNNRRGGEEVIAEEENFTDVTQAEKVELTTQLTVYPNPAKPTEYLQQQAGVVWQDCHL